MAYNDIDDLTTILDRLPNGHRTPFQLQVAIAVVLLEAASADDEGLKPEELSEISAQGVSQFGLSGEEVGHLLMVAGMLRKEEEKRKTLMSTIERSFSHDQKVALMALVWRVLLADKKMDEGEGSVAVILRKELGLSMEAAVGARAMAERSALSELLATVVSSDESE
jgi:uncharacterized tellurite resistance protein B-like protein